MLFSPRYATFFPDDMMPDALPDDVIQATAKDQRDAEGRADDETVVVTGGKIYIVKNSM